MGSPGHDRRSRDDRQYHRARLWQGLHGLCLRSRRSNPWRLRHSSSCPTRDLRRLPAKATGSTRGLTSCGRAPARPVAIVGRGHPVTGPLGGSRRHRTFDRLSRLRGGLVPILSHCAPCRALLNDRGDADDPTTTSDTSRRNSPLSRGLRRPECGCALRDSFAHGTPVLADMAGERLATDRWQAKGYGTGRASLLDRDRRPLGPRGGSGGGGMREKQFRRRDD